MPLIEYTTKKFNAEHEVIIVQANVILDEFATEGYDVTLRQLYYQFVSRDLFPASWVDEATGSTNNMRSYKKLGTIISDARRAGRIDWDRISDITRHVRSTPSWSSPKSILDSCASQFNVDWWADQQYRPEVWVEKDALISVLEVACRDWYCPYFSCRGYVSDSEAWQASQRFNRHIENGQTPLVIHLGDHDPSGIDMSRDIKDRLKLFGGNGGAFDHPVEVRRIALTMDQIEEHNPPPNPAKETDARFASYRENYGDQSWELDALNPATLTALITDTLESVVDRTAWEETRQRRDEGRRILGQVVSNWDEITENL